MKMRTMAMITLACRRQEHEFPDISEMGGHAAFSAAAAKAQPFSCKRPQNRALVLLCRKQCLPPSER